MLALRAGAALLPCYCVREGANRHVITYLAPIEIERSGNRARDVETLTAACNAALEDIIRKHPEQWMWSHRRFRHSPDLETEPYA
jgi:KDO2-lipid IV(A) lauroyltransferase